MAKSTVIHFPPIPCEIWTADGKHKITEGLRMATMPPGDWHMEQFDGKILLTDRSGMNGAYVIENGEMKKLGCGCENDRT